MAPDWSPLPLSQDALERKEANEAAEYRRQAFNARKQADMLQRRAKTAAVRTAVQQGGASATHRYTSAKQQQGAETRAAQQRWRQEREQKDKAREMRAQTARASAAKSRLNAAEARKKQEEARKVRAHSPTL